MPDPAEAPPRCPFSRHYSYRTEQYTIAVGWAELSEIIAMIDDLWEHVEAGVPKADDKTGAMFSALLDHVDGLREWTGWGGVPGQYLESPDPLLAATVAAEVAR